MKNDLIAEVLMDSKFEGIENLFRKTLATKLSLGMIMFATYVGCAYSDTFERAYDFLINHNVQVSHSHFQDPRGLDIDIERNDMGRREVYLRYEDKKIPVGYDMLPTTDMMLEGIERRMLNKDEKAYITDRLREILDQD